MTTTLNIPVFTKAKPVARVFPKRVRDTLIAASQVDRLKGPGESIARTQAVERAVAIARRECPGLFNNEKE